MEESNTATQAPPAKVLLESLIRALSVVEDARHDNTSRVLTAKQANEHVRGHWLVENRLHWFLDMTFGQDASRIRTGNAAANFAVVRHFALNIIRHYQGDRYSVPRRRRLSDFHRD